MRSYYCKNCNNKIGIFCDIKKYFISDKCYHSYAENNKLLDFLDCLNCNKSVGIICYDICINCFGEHSILEEEKLKKLFVKYKKIKPKYVNRKYYCIICNKNKFRGQYWFFKELTFYK